MYLKNDISKKKNMVKWKADRSYKQNPIGTNISVGLTSRATSKEHFVGIFFLKW